MNEMETEIFEKGLFWITSILDLNKYFSKAPYYLISNKSAKDVFEILYHTSLDQETCLEDIEQMNKLLTELQDVHQQKTGVVLLPKTSAATRLSTKRCWFYKSGLPLDFFTKNYPLLEAASKLPKWIFSSSSRIFDLLRNNATEEDKLFLNNFKQACIKFRDLILSLIPTPLLEELDHILQINQDFPRCYKKEDFDDLCPWYYLTPEQYNQIKSTRLDLTKRLNKRLSVSFRKFKSKGKSSYTKSKSYFNNSTLSYDLFFMDVFLALKNFKGADSWIMDHNLDSLKAELCTPKEEIMEAFYKQGELLNPGAIIPTYVSKKWIGYFSDGPDYKLQNSCINQRVENAPNLPAYFKFKSTHQVLPDQYDPLEDTSDPKTKPCFYAGYCWHISFVAIQKRPNNNSEYCSFLGYNDAYFTLPEEYLHYYSQYRPDLADENSLKKGVLYFLASRWCERLGTGNYNKGYDLYSLIKGQKTLFDWLTGNVPQKHSWFHPGDLLPMVDITNALKKQKICQEVDLAKIWHEGLGLHLTPLNPNLGDYFLLWKS